MYRVYYTDQPKLPLATWQVKVLSVDHALGSPSPYEASTGDVDTNRPPSHLTLITHLQSNATYYIRISASNAKGDGPPSAAYPVIVRPGGELATLFVGQSPRPLPPQPPPPLSPPSTHTGLTRHLHVIMYRM
ncbi:unnamed protein product [Dibothriocephalus latus]|uniref:Fibronectin type-III domain-containing protein n=1 Tax=Dibothriocephalus latus TaxID=60516 RepID=A0A3P7NNA7_DIBLA|nr:unnamed protein product [Dibothriocephalus latus]